MISSYHMYQGNFHLATLKQLFVNVMLYGLLRNLSSPGSNTRFKYMENSGSLILRMLHQMENGNNSLYFRTYYLITNFNIYCNKKC